MGNFTFTLAGGSGFLSLSADGTVEMDLLLGHNICPVCTMVNIAQMLGHVEAPKWTTATYHQFLYDPDTFMFLKPVATQRAARTCGVDIHYRPELNWRTYDSVQAFARHLRDQLRELKPRDMIDV